MAGAVEERTSVGTFFKTKWEELRPNVPVAWPGREMTPPDGPWIRFSMVQEDAFQIEFGGQVNQHRFTGIILMSAFSKMNTGDQEALDMADDIAGIFIGTRRVNLGTEGSVLFRTPETRTIGPDGRGLSDESGVEASSYFQVNVSIPYQRDSVF